MIVGITGYIGSGKDELGKMLQWAMTRPDISYSSFAQLDDYEQTKHWKIKKFAGGVKEIVALLIGCSVSALEDRDFKNKPLGPDWVRYIIYREDEFGGEVMVDLLSSYDEVKEKYGTYGGYYLYRKQELTPRIFMQLMGTDAGRNVIHPNIWISSLFNDYSETKWTNFLGETVSDNWIITDLRFPNEHKAIKNKNGITIRVNRPGLSSDGHESERYVKDLPVDIEVQNDSDLQALEKIALTLKKKILNQI